MSKTVPMRKGALIGCGFFSKNHLHAWAQLPGAQIVALCDAHPQRLQDASAEFAIDRLYASAEQLFASETLDFVDIATTVDSHRALVELAAVHGVPVICQKPFAHHLDDALAMIRACRQAGVPLMVHENFRWQSSIQAVHRALCEGHIGRPFWGRVSFRSAYDVFAGQPYLATEERFILQDLGIHSIDIARFLFGEVQTLSASTAHVNTRIRGEDVATLLMKHSSGLTSVVDCSYATALPDELFPQTLVEVDAELGTLRLLANYQLSIHVRGQATQIHDCAPTLHPWAQRPWHNIQDSVLSIQAHWLACLNDGREPQTSGADNFKTLLLVEKAYESAACQQKTIDIEKATPSC